LDRLFGIYRKIDPPYGQAPLGGVFYYYDRKGPMNLGVDATLFAPF
jgi:hypothetical protein